MNQQHKVGIEAIHV